MVIVNCQHGMYPGTHPVDRLLIGNAANADIDGSIFCPGPFVQQEQADSIDRALTQVSGSGVFLRVQKVPEPVSLGLKTSMKRPGRVCERSPDLAAVTFRIDKNGIPMVPVLV